jgi:hypothetical protein
VLQSHKTYKHNDARKSWEDEAMLDDLRRSAAEGFEEEEEEEEIVAADPDDTGGRSFLGLSPVERMLLSILVFMLVTAIGVLLLMMTGRLVL